MALKREVKILKAVCVWIVKVHIGIESNCQINSDMSREREREREIYCIAL